MEKGTIHSSQMAGGPTARVSLKDEDYCIILANNEEHSKGFNSIDVSFQSHTIRIYDDRPWKIHHMDSSSRTIRFETLQES